MSTPPLYNQRQLRRRCYYQGSDRLSTLSRPPPKSHFSQPKTAQLSALIRQLGSKGENASVFIEHPLDLVRIYGLR